SFAPLPRSDDRFARQNRFRPPPEFPLASSCPGKGHHLSGGNMYALTPLCGQVHVERVDVAPTYKMPDHVSVKINLPSHFLTPLSCRYSMTRVHVTLLGPCFKTGRIGYRPTRR